MIPFSIVRHFLLSKLCRKELAAATRIQAWRVIRGMLGMPPKLANDDTLPVTEIISVPVDIGIHLLVLFLIHHFRTCSNSLIIVYLDMDITFLLRLN